LRLIVLVILALGTLAVLPAAAAERQSSMNLFPQDTLLFVRTANAKEFFERLKDTSTGRLLADPQIKPFFNRLLGEVSTLYTEQAADTVGLTFNELLNLPKGEIAFGIVARPNAQPALLLLVDQAGERSTARTLLDRALAQAKADGIETTKQTMENFEVTVLHTGLGTSDGKIGIFERDGTIVASTDLDVSRHVLWHWDGAHSPTEAASATGGILPITTEEHGFIPGSTFDKNEKFIDILKQCRRPNDPPPNLILYVDPLGLMRQFGRANPGMQIALAFLPQIGLDGLQAVGGAATFATGRFENLVHLHVLLDNPRAGILSMIDFGTGETKPQPWVPLDSVSYTTLRWKFRVFYDRLAAIVDRFRGPGAFDEFIADGPANDLGIDFKTEIVDNLAGRVTLVTGIEKPVRFQSMQRVVAIELVNEAAANRTLQTILTRVPSRFAQRHFGPITYHSIILDGFDQMPEDQVPIHPFVAIMDKHLILGTSTKVFEQMITARQGDAKRMADSEDYTRIADTLSNETAGTQPAIVTISRPVLVWRLYYDLLMSEQVREFIEEAASEEPIVERFAAILREGALPPFEALAKYFGPAGGILYDTDNGYHGVSFTLRGE
jgi:hypothetical protein